jgi:hypothetical protein
MAARLLSWLQSPGLLLALRDEWNERSSAAIVEEPDLLLR